MLLRVEDQTGAVRALVVHYACHAVVLGASNCQYSADYPGIMQERVEAQMKGVQAMFVQGGAGDINPILLGRSEDPEQNYATVVKVGELLAREVLQAARQIAPGKPNRYPILSSSEILTFSNRWPDGPPLHVGITTLLINGEIAIAAVPGEPMHRLQVAWKANAEVAHPFFWGYTYSAGGEWPGYIPDLRSAAHGGYGADSSIEIGAGETIVQRHLKNLYGLQGMWDQNRSRK